MSKYSSITTASLPTVLATRGDNLNNITSILISNTHSSNAASVDLYIQDSSNNTFYLIKNTSIPVGASLALTNNVKFNNSSSGYSLIAQIASGSIDVHLKQN
tara:strand:+ start:386 stop:691 length:306 start_codon:yes stop_codon:yes gene_type:complete